MRLRQNWRPLLSAFGLLAQCGAHAQNNAVPPPSAPPQRSAGELDRLVQPIASYPDYLVGIILPASVYPLEVGDAAFQLAQTNVAVDLRAQSWEPSVQSLAQFPSLVQWMDRSLPWTVELGRAVVAQQKDVLDAVQRVRARGYAAGILRSDGFNLVTKTMTGSGKDIITIAPVTQPAGASPPSQATSLTNSTPGAATPTTTVPAAIYSAPPSAYGAPPSPSASRAARAVVGVAALAVVANNVDWEDKYVINTPGGAVVVDEDDLEDIQENYHRPSAQPTATGTSSRASPSIATTAAKPTTQPAGQPAPSTKPAVTPWQPNPSHMASGGAPQPSTANQSAAARGWSQPSTSLTGQPRTSPAAASSRASNAYTGGWARPSEGIRARAYSGRGATSRSGGTRGR